jgi:transcriptional regulator with XRE-family HTH domain
MEERIKTFMEYKGISSSELADSIGVQRSNVTHVLKARNKPSFQFIEKMLQIYPDLNAKWLLLGTGNMVETLPKSRTLFDQLTEPAPALEIVQDQKVLKIDEVPLNRVKISESASSQLKKDEIPHQEEEKVIKNELHDQFFSSEKPIESLVVFFKDQTFKVYNPSR